ncbi:hypothetical protein SDJN02_12013, partial [Cucurbita argyrosperma subsp. argyrosperma]
MKTLMIVEQYRYEFFTLFKNLGMSRLGNFTIKEDREENQNRLSNQSGTGFRPVPLEMSSIPVCRPSSPKIQPPSTDCNPKPISPTPRSDPIPISPEICDDFDEHCCYNKSSSYPELWAGPTYSNSPPASSLPMPNFSIRRNIILSLQLPTGSTAQAIRRTQPIVKSAPPSPTRGHNHRPSSSRELFHGVDDATRTLKQILHLDIDSE